MNEEEIKKDIELLKKAVDNNHKISGHCYYFDDYQMSKLRQKTFKLADRLNEEKEKNKKLEETINNLAKAVKFMGTNDELTADEIIKMFSPKEIKIDFDDFMKRWENEQHKKANLKDKVIDMMAKELIQDGIFVNSNLEDVKQYYFKKARGEENE